MILATFVMRQFGIPLRACIPASIFSMMPGHEEFWNGGRHSLFLYFCDDHYLKPMRVL
jgi:hypothetical protein